MTNFIENDGIKANFVDGVLYYSFPHLSSQPKLIHGFSSRIGGISSDAFASLNLAHVTGGEIKDSSENVHQNMGIFAKAVGFNLARSLTARQKHGANIRLVKPEDAGTGIFCPSLYDNIDGLICTMPDTPIITYHADCLALFFYAPDRHIIGLAHAGWRGTAAEIGPKIVAQMADLGCDKKQILAGIGPGAGPCHYQVGAELLPHFADFADEQGSVIHPDPNQADKYLLDLGRTNIILLKKAGLKEQNIIDSRLCTICHSDTFYSHRVQGSQRGTMAAVMMLL